MIAMAASLTRAFWYGHSIGTPAQSKEEDGSELHLETLRCRSWICLVLSADGW